MNYQDSMQAKRSVCNPENWVTNIPQELRDRPQWCVAGEDKAPRIAAHGLPFAKSNDPATWRTFDEASAFAATVIGPGALTKGLGKGNHGGHDVSRE